MAKGYIWILVLFVKSYAGPQLSLSQEAQDPHLLSVLLFNFRICLWARGPISLAFSCDCSELGTKYLCQKEAESYHLFYSKTVSSSGLSCFSHVQVFVTPWVVARQAPLPGILQARRLEWVAIPSPGDLPDPEIKPESLMSPAFSGRFPPLGKPPKCMMQNFSSAKALGSAPLENSLPSCELSSQFLPPSSLSLSSSDSPRHP